MNEFFLRPATRPQVRVKLRLLSAHEPSHVGIDDEMAITMRVFRRRWERASVCPIHCSVRAESWENNLRHIGGGGVKRRRQRRMVASDVYVDRRRPGANKPDRHYARLAAARFTQRSAGEQPSLWECHAKTPHVGFSCIAQWPVSTYVTASFWTDTFTALLRIREWCVWFQWRRKYCSYIIMFRL